MGYQDNNMTMLQFLPIALVSLFATCQLHAADAAVVRVPTVTAGQSAAGVVMDFDAVLQPVRQATVTAQVAGNVLALSVKAGDTVRRGQALARLDDREGRANTTRSDAAVAQAEAELRNVQQVLDRNRELKKNGFISAAALDNAENQVKSAQAALRQAQAARAQATVAQGFAELAAPFDAVVLATHVQSGDLAMPGRALVTLYQPGLLRAVVQVPASQVASVAALPDVQVLLPDGQALVPTARDMLPTADPVSQTVEWRLPLPTKAADLRPGQMARVRVSGRTPSSTDVSARLALPRSAILHRGELTAVYVAMAQGFSLRAVRLGVDDGSMVQILTGLRAGERVALDPVRAGMPGAVAE
jgi:RND family efflux transporter MFP subunit